MRYSSWVIVLLLLVLCFVAEGQQITQAEYYWDFDPGIGMGTPVILSQTPELDEEFEIELNTEGVGEGMHLICMRFQNSEGDWSLVREIPIYVQGQEYDYKEQVITHAEYFWNDDPGVGQADEIELEEIESFADIMKPNVSELSLGSQLFGVRFKNSGGLWSQTYNMPVFIQEYNSRFEDQKLVAAEYFWDSETGAGEATALDITESDTLVNVFDISTGNIEEGMHLLSLRFQNTAGNWCELTELPVFAQALGYVYAEQKVVELEYFDGEDPGFGNGEIISLTPEDTSNPMVYIELTGLDVGLHVGGVRLKNSAGEWGETKEMPFFVDPERPDIVSYTYYFDGDTVSKLFMDVTMPADTLMEEASIDIAGLELGIHQLYLQVNDAKDRHSVFLMQEFEVERNTSTVEDELQGLYVYSESGRIYICNNLDHELIKVFDVSGQLIESFLPAKEMSVISLHVNGVYLIKVGAEVFKVVCM